MTKRVPLVCQHLEGIHRAALEDYQKIIVVAYVKDREGFMPFTDAASSTTWA